MKELKLLIKDGWELNDNANIIKAIINRIFKCDGECPCATNKIENHEDKLCPCKDYRENDVCHCQLYVKNIKVPKEDIRNFVVETFNINKQSEASIFFDEEDMFCTISLPSLKVSKNSLDILKEKMKEFGFKLFIDFELHEIWKDHGSIMFKKA